MPDNLQPGMQNCAEIAPAANDPNPANNRRCIPVEVAPDLQTRKVQRTAQCRPGGLCDFELWFINRGPGPWTGRPETVDTLPDGATFVSASGGSICTQAGGNLTCRSPREVTLAPGGLSRLVVTLRMPRNAQSGARNCLAIADALTAGDANPANNRECIDVRISPPPPPDIQVLKTQATNACTPGESCTFDLWFINRGPGRWTGTPQLSDTLPPHATFESGSAPWSCQQSGTTVSCAHDRVTLPAGRGVKVSVTARLPADMPANTRNCVRSAAEGEAGHDPVPQNNERCITIRTTPPPEPEGTEPTEPHEPAPHEPTPAETPHEPTPEETAPEHPPESPSPPRPAPTPAQPADIRSEKKQLGPCKPGHSCLFELKFVNKGPVAWSGRAKLSDLLPDQLWDATLSTWSPSTWKCAQNGTSIGCEHAGATVAPGEDLSVSITVKLPDHLPAGAQNCVVIERPEFGHPHLIGDRQCVTIDVATPGFAPRPPTVVHPSEPCPHGTVKQGDQCVTLTCPSGYVLKGDKCYSTEQSCPAGYVLKGDKCYSTQQSCPAGYVLKGDKCYSTQPSCPAGYVLKGDKCYSTQLSCPKGYVLRGKTCYSTQPSCPRGYVLRGNKCYSTQPTCPSGYVLRGRLCYPPVQRVCPPGYYRSGNVCIRPGYQQPRGHQQPRIHGH
jgi:uncharacterized repeat protein (TIGR01451 family)